MQYILGPCCASTEKEYFENGEALIKIMDECNIPSDSWYYKSSFLKANRSSNQGGIGRGQYAVEWFQKFKKQYPNIQLTTDVHECTQVRRLIYFIDLIQIPAMLSRQTFLIRECARYFSKVNIKKGQMISPSNMCNGVGKIKDINPDCEAWVTERGSSFGYGNLLIDFGAVDRLKSVFDQTILDVTHSTQRLKADGFTTGSYELAEKFFKAAPIFGYTGIFAETCLRPEASISDKDSIIPMEHIKDLVLQSEEIG